MRTVEQILKRMELNAKGGSGNFGHSGRPGERGGSGEGGGASAI